VAAVTADDLATPYAVGIMQDNVKGFDFWMGSQKGLGLGPGGTGGAMGGGHGALALGQIGGQGDGGRTVVWQVAMALAIGFMKWDCARRDAERNVDHIALGSHRDDFARVGPDMRFAQTFSQGGKAETQETAGRHGDAGIRIDQGQAIVLKD